MVKFNKNSTLEGVAVLDQLVVHRLEQGQEPLQAVGQGALRQVQALRAQILQQPVGRPVEQELVEQDGDPDRDAQDALGDHFGGGRRRDDAGVAATGAGGAIPPAPVDPAMGVHFNLQDRRVLGPGEGDKRLSTTGAALLFGGQFDHLFHGGQMGVVPAFRPRSSPLLSAWPWRPGGAGEAVCRGRGVGLASKELLLAEAELGLEVSDLLLELGLACDGAVEHGLVVRGLTPGLELLGQPWADRARLLGNGGSRAGREVEVPGREGDRSGARPESRGTLSRHAARCNRGRTGKPESRMGLPNLYGITPKSYWKPA